MSVLVSFQDSVELQTGDVSDVCVSDCVAAVCSSCYSLDSRCVSLCMIVLQQCAAAVTPWTVAACPCVYLMCASLIVLQQCAAAVTPWTVAACPCV